MKLSRKWILVAALVLSVAMATSGTLAYLTDRESATNVFTFGNVDITLNEEFDQATPLVPGVTVDKKVTISNKGTTDAWVWYTLAIPDELDSDKASENVIHTNIPGSNWYGYHTNKNYWQEGQTEALADEKTWIIDAPVFANGAKSITTTINGVECTVYAHLYKGALKPGETTSMGLGQVYMDYHIDIDPEGNLYHVEKGVVTPINWNINENGTPTIYLAAYAIQKDGFKTIEEAFAAYTEQWGENGGVEYDTLETYTVSTSAELQAAVNAKTSGTTVISIAKDIAGDVTVPQNPGYEVIINGNGHDFAGVLLVNGKSGTYRTSAVTIENVNFVADSISADACIRLGDGTNATRYTCNVTVKNCTFDVPGAVGIKSYTGGDKNLKVIGCTFKAGMHSALQAANIEEGLTVTNCKVYSKNGINLNLTPSLEMSGCDIDTTGYSVRFGVNNSTVKGTFNISDSTLKSACDDGDAVIMLRGTMAESTVNLTNTTVTGTTKVTGTANIIGLN